MTDELTQKKREGTQIDYILIDNEKKKIRTIEYINDKLETLQMHQYSTRGENYGIKLTFYNDTLLGGITIYRDENNFTYKQYFDEYQYKNDFYISNSFSVNNVIYNVGLIRKTINNVQRIEYNINELLGSIAYSDYF